jgi:uncharacterized OB-fold protein
MAKALTFQEKAAKAAQIKGTKCPVCGTVFQPILLVSSERSARGAGWKFNEKRVQVCKCNEKQVYA